MVMLTRNGRLLCSLAVLSVVFFIIQLKYNASLDHHDISILLQQPQTKTKQHAKSSIASTSTNTNNAFIDTNTNLNKDDDNNDDVELCNGDITQVDLVFTWVNGSDSSLLRALRSSQTDILNSSSNPFQTAMDATHLSKFMDFDELKYSLRSVDMYAPWIRHIYIVTNGQVPIWLNTSHPKLSLISHTDIFKNTSHLPTFNSAAIEVNLINIPGLSEHFIYMNDDTFLLQNISLSDFWSTARGYRVYFSWMLSSCTLNVQQQSSFLRALCHSYRLLQSKFPSADVKQKFTVGHVPILISKCVLQSMYNLFESAIESTSSHSLRAIDDIQFQYLYSHSLLSQTVNVQSIYHLFDSFDKNRNGYLEDHEPKLLIDSISTNDITMLSGSDIEAYSNCTSASVNPALTFTVFESCVNNFSSTLQLVLRSIRVPRFRGESVNVGSYGAFTALTDRLSDLGSVQHVFDNLKFKFACINNELSADADAELISFIHGRFQQILQKRYPQPSQYELVPSSSNKLTSSNTSITSESDSKSPKPQSTSTGIHLDAALLNQTRKLHQPVQVMSESGSLELANVSTNSNGSLQSKAVDLNGTVVDSVLTRPSPTPSERRVKKPKKKIVSPVIVDSVPEPSQEPTQPTNSSLKQQQTAPATELQKSQVKYDPRNFMGYERGLWKKGLYSYINTSVANRFMSLSPEEDLVPPVLRCNEINPCPDFGSIDVVYTWVNGSEKNHMLIRQAVQHNLMKLTHTPDSFSEHRFRDLDELRFSIRSVELHLPWIRKIHLVTNGQIPYWLNISHPKISIVTHHQIFANKNDLPTFNSAAIESNLHRIPGLSDHFIYLNDDLFMLKPVQPTDFWTVENGYKIYTAWQFGVCNGPRALNSSYAKALCLSQKLVSQKFGIKKIQRHTISHAPFLFYKPTIERLHRLYPPSLLQTSSHQFRSPKDIQFAYLYYQSMMAESRSPIGFKEVFTRFDTDKDGGWNISEISAVGPFLKSERWLTESFSSNYTVFLNCLYKRFTLRSVLQYERFRTCLESAPYIVQYAFSTVRIPVHLYQNLDQTSHGAFGSLSGSYKDSVGSINLLNSRKLFYVCINNDLDGTVNRNKSEAIRKRFERTLRKRFPDRSSFELTSEPASYDIEKEILNEFDVELANLNRRKNKTSTVTVSDDDENDEKHEIDSRIFKVFTVKQVEDEFDRQRKALSKRKKPLIPRIRASVGSHMNSIITAEAGESGTTQQRIKRTKVVESALESTQMNQTTISPRQKEKGKERQ